MIKKIVHKIKSRALNNIPIVKSVNRQFIPLFDVKSVLVLIYEEDSHYLSVIHSYFEKRNVKVDWIAYSSKSVSEENQIVTFKQITWNGKLRNQDVEQCLLTGHDLLMDLTTHKENALLNFLVNHAQTRYKVGFIQRNTTDITLQLDKNESLDVRIKEMFKLLEGLKRY